MSDYWARRIDSEWDYEEVRQGEHYRVVALLEIPADIRELNEATRYMSTICTVRTEEMAVHLVEVHNQWRNALADNVG